MKTFKSLFNLLFPKTKAIVGQQYIDRYDLPIYFHGKVFETFKVESVNNSSIEIINNQNQKQKVSHKEFQRFIPLP